MAGWIPTIRVKLQLYDPKRKHLPSPLPPDYVPAGGTQTEPLRKEQCVERGPIVRLLVVVQILLFLAGLALTLTWIIGRGPWHGWWCNLPMVGILLGSLLAFSHQEARFGLAAGRRKRDDPDSMGGWIERIAFTTWLLLLANMIATVFKGIRAIKAAV